jgi:hypothetical protein
MSLIAIGVAGTIVIASVVMVATLTATSSSTSRGQSDNTSTITAPSLSDMQTISPDSVAPEQLKKYYWLSAAWINQTALDELFRSESFPRTLPFTPFTSDTPTTKVTDELLSNNELMFLYEAFRGAEGCRDRTEVCVVSYGIMSSEDTQEDYEMSVSEEQVRQLRKELQFSLERDDALLSYEDGLYWLKINSRSDFKTPQVRAEFVQDIPSDAVHLDRSGQGANNTVSYYFSIKTWATFGAPAEVKLYARPSISDSGIITTVEPDTLVLNERSEEKVKLTITAGKDAKEGIFEIAVWGKYAGDELKEMGPMYGPSVSPCRSGCPTVQVGDSHWRVVSIGGAGGTGGKAPPESLDFRITTDKNLYRMGETITFTAYLDNSPDGEEIVLDDARLFINIYPSDTSIAANVYNVDAWLMGSLHDDSYDVKKIRPGSTVLLAYPFEWDQYVLKGGIPSDDIAAPGSYNVHATFSMSSEKYGPQGYGFYYEKEITIAEG